MIVINEPQTVVAPNVSLPLDCVIGHGTIVGHGSDLPAPAIGLGVTIGAFCVVHSGATIGDRVSIDHYCRIGANVRVGSDTRVLYGAQLFDECAVGNRCIVGGDISERVVMEDDVTFMGALAHSHRDPSLAWDSTEEPSAILRRGCVVGVNALLIGGITIGEGSYIGAREVVRTNVPAKTVVVGGVWTPLEKWRGFIKTRL